MHDFADIRLQDCRKHGNFVIIHSLITQKKKTLSHYSDLNLPFISLRSKLDSYYENNTFSKNIQLFLIVCSLLLLIIIIIIKVHFLSLSLLTAFIEKLHSLDFNLKLSNYLPTVKPMSINHVLNEWSYSYVKLHLFY